MLSPTSAWYQVPVLSLSSPWHPAGLFAAVVQDFSRKREIPLEAVELKYTVACPEAEVTLIKFDSLNITLWVHQSH